MSWITLPSGPTVPGEPQKYSGAIIDSEERRMHVHVSHPDGTAKFWLEPRIELANNSHLSAMQLTQIEASIRRHQDELISAWQYYFRN